MKFVKIIYFDESFVADFMQIIAGGEIKKTTEFISNVSADVQGEGNASASIGTEGKGVSKLFSFLSGVSLNAEVSASTETSYKRDKVVKNILENTLLSDFVGLIKNDAKRKPDNQRCKGISVFQKLKVYPEPNSFSFFMLAAPFFSMLKGDIPINNADGTTFNLDITKMEEAIDKGRGYYEFIAIYQGSEIILRFNISAFRNNYTMSDLPKMQLTYYAIRVGKTDKAKLQIEKEFEFGTRVLSRADYSGLSANNGINEIEVFDVVLAGIEEQ